MDTWKDENYQYVKEEHSTDNPEHVRVATENEFLSHGYEIVSSEVVPTKNPERGAYTVIITAKRSLDYNNSKGR